MFKKFRKTNIKHIAEKVDTLNMNLALIPLETIQKIGFLSNFFTHSFADYEYGLRVSLSTGGVWVCPGVVGYCDRNEEIQLSRFNSVFELNNYIKSPLGLPFRDRYHFLKNCGGQLWLLEYAYPYIKIYCNYFLTKILQKIRRF